MGRLLHRARRRAITSDDVTDDQRQSANELVSTIITLVLAVVLAVVVQAVAIKPFKIPSGSMTNTLQVGERILVDRVGVNLGKVGISGMSVPEVDDIIVFHPPVNFAAQACGNAGAGALGTDAMCDRTSSDQPADETFVKRVVGLPGDTLSLRDGHVVRNGKLTSEPFIIPCEPGQCTLPQTIVVPAGTVYVLGDNRADSNDGRFWGPVPQRWIVGKARVSYWPPSRIGVLN